MTDALLTTPFRDHYEHSRTLDCERQIRECADYLQHPDVLVMEFLESYYLVERKWDPARHDAEVEAEPGELILEPFHDALELEIRGGAGGAERVLCVGGAFDPLPGDAHPAIRHRGLDYVGVRGDASRIVLGVMETPAEQSAYPLLLRALNCFAEVSTPFQLARLRRLVLGDRVDSDATFDVQIGVTRPPESPEEATLVELVRDLAEAFKVGIGDNPQFAGTLGWIELLTLESEDSGMRRTLHGDWRV